MARSSQGRTNRPGERGKTLVYVGGVVQSLSLTFDPGMRFQFITVLSDADPQVAIQTHSLQEKRQHQCLGKAGSSQETVPRGDSDHAGRLLWRDLCIADRAAVAS
jgi:hypothetical protein